MTEGFPGLFKTDKNPGVPYKSLKNKEINFDSIFDNNTLIFYDSTVLITASNCR
jgi:hypothetical protein